MAGSTRILEDIGHAGIPRIPAGHLRAFEEGGGGNVGRPRPALPAWITDELIAETRRVWSRHLQRVVSDEEAVEMLQGVGSAGLAILAAKLPGGQP